MRLILNSNPFNRVIFQCTNLLLKAQPDSSPFVSAEHIEAKLVQSVKHNWMGLHKYYKQHSDDNHVSTEIFQAGLESVGIVLSVMDLSILCKKYDSKGSHRIAFKEFLRKFTVSGRVSGMSGRVSAANSRDSRMVSCHNLSQNIFFQQQKLKTNNYKKGEIIPLKPPVLSRVH